MTRYRYRASRLDGGIAEGVVDAVTVDAANDAIWSQGLTPFDMRPVADPDTKWWRRELFSGGGSRAADLVTFTREFSTLSAADIPLDDTLRILSEQASSPRLRAVVASLMADILNGATLSNAMQNQGKMFPDEYTSMVRAGEIGGTLNQVFVELADLLERRMEIRASVQSALVYPCILVVLAIGTLAAIVGGLIPSIAPIFNENGRGMPAIIQLMLAVQASWLEIVIAITLVATAATALMSFAARKPSVRLMVDRHKLQVPLLGPFLLQQETARFARTLGTMLKAGVPLVQAAQSACGVVGNRYLAAGVDRAIEAVHQGVSLHRALRDETKLPTIALQMISVGEEAGRLDRMLVRVAVMLEGQIKSSIDRFLSAFTPALTVGIALMVGVLIMPVMSAVLSINDLATR